MTIQSEAELLMQLRKDYEARGYTLEPGQALETPEGGRARPDMVARKDGRTELIAVRPYGGDERDEERIRALSRLAAESEGWSFRLYLVEGPETALPEPPDAADITALLDQARTLQETGDRALALVAAWSALEAAARSALSGHERRPALFPSSALVKELISYGYLGQDHLTRFHDLARKRDLAAHGFFRQQPEENEVGAVIALAEQLTGARARELEVAALHRSAGQKNGASGRRRGKTAPRQ